MKNEEELTRKELHECSAPVDYLFGLSRANYYTVPRVVLQSMPIDWQRRFVEMVEEMNSCIDWVHKDYAYSVVLIDDIADTEVDFTVHRKRCDDDGNVLQEYEDTYPHEDDYGVYRHKSFELKKIPSTTKIYYFGCVGTSGHRLHAPGTKLNYDDWEEKPEPFITATYYVGLPWTKEEADSSLCPKNTTFEGKCLLHRKNGWSAVAFWDRSIDKRQGSHSTFFVQGDYNFSLIVNYIEEKFPTVYDRYTFPLERIEE